MSNKPEFYVGYLAMPPRLKWIIRGLIVVLLGLVALDAWLIAQLQQQPGDGRWAETPQEFVGTLTRAPYPTLRSIENGAPRTYIVISDEKRGAEPMLAGIEDGASVKIQGYLIERAAVGMIQLAATGNDVAKTDAPPVADADREIHGAVTIEGEIVDSKCWLGVMRPGDGHIHKACASLCIRGGIPPMFVSRGGDAPPVMLMTLPDGRAIPPDDILDHVADRVSLTGIIEKRGDVTVFKVDLASLKRTHSGH